MSGAGLANRFQLSRERFDDAAKSFPIKEVDCLGMRADLRFEVGRPLEFALGEPTIKLKIATGTNKQN